ncbi:MAG: hypothetical protein V2A69_08805 [Pseudomonadota bacterium]
MIIQDCHIRIDKEGNWFYNSQPITNENIYLYFNQHLVKDSEENCFLKIKDQVCLLEVEDTPYIIKHINIINELPPKIKVLLNDKTTEILPWDQVWIKGDRQIYCLVKNGQFKARFNRNSQFELGDALQFDPERERYYLEVGGKNYYLSVR